MSWTRDLDSNLVNLDHVQAIDVAELEEANGSETHCLLARFPGDNDRILDTGTEDEMRNKQSLFTSKLPMVKLV